MDWRRLKELPKTVLAIGLGVILIIIMVLSRGGSRAEITIRNADQLRQVDFITGDAVAGDVKFHRQEPILAIAWFDDGVWVVNLDQISRSIHLMEGEEGGSNPFRVLVALNLDGTLLAAGNRGGVTVWDLVTGRVIHRSNDAPVFSLSFDPEDRLAAVSGERRQTKVWQLPSGNTVFDCNCDDTVFLFNPRDGSFISSNPNGVDFGNANFEVLGQLLSGFFVGDVPNEMVQSMAIHPDGAQLAIALQNEIKVWDLTTILPPIRILPEDTWIKDLALSPDGTILGAVAGDGIYLWRTSNGRQIAYYPIPQAQALAFSPDSTLLAVAQFGGVSLWGVR